VTESTFINAACFRQVQVAVSILLVDIYQSSENNGGGGKWLFAATIFCESDFSFTSNRNLSAG
jgi:hypothetical protein